MGKDAYEALVNLLTVAQIDLYMARDRYLRGLSSAEHMLEASALVGFLEEVRDGR
jgi:hypothetical protein